MRSSASFRLSSASVRIFALAPAFALLGVLAGCAGGGSSPAPVPVISPPPVTPSVSSISPTSVPAGSAALTLTISGSGFVSSSVVQVGGLADATTYASASQLTVTVPASQIASGASLGVIVTNGSVSSGSASAPNLQVDNPAPTIASFSPTSAVAGSPAAVVVLTGTGFVPSTVVNVNGTARATTFTSSTQVIGTLSAADFASAGGLSITAVNSAPGGGTSAGVSLSVTNPMPPPAILQLNPSSLIAGSMSATTVTVTGTGFIATPVVQVNGSPRSTASLSASTLTFVATIGDQASAGSLAITVTNPGPSGATSAAASLPVNNPSVGPLQLNPASLSAGATTPATITVTGSTFLPSSVLKVNGSTRAATYVNATTLTFVASVADQSVAGSLGVTVTNPTPGGGSSPSAMLTIAGPPSTPVISSVSPSSITAGSQPVSLTITGSGFNSTSVVQWNGANLPTTLATFYNGATLYATVPASDLAATGTANITVNTPRATPPLSNAVMVTIVSAPPLTLSTLYPSGGPINTDTSVTLSGTGFTPGSTVALNGQTIPSTYQNPIQITATFPAAYLATPGNVDVTVTTPGTGGGTSAPQVFTTFVSLPNNDIAYNPVNGFLYASVPVETVGDAGNSVAEIDPLTGIVRRSILVGTNPNKLAISPDGTQIFVGIDGAGAVAQVDLAQGKVVNQFSLGGGAGLYNPPYTAQYLAAVPGLRNSVAVAVSGGFTSGTGVTIFDAGVARPNSSSNVGEGPLSFGASAATLYMSGSAIESLTVGASGITSSSTVYPAPSVNTPALQYDNGLLYLADSAVVRASTGTLLGTFYSSAGVPAYGPVMSDSTLGRASVGVSSYSNNSAQVLVYNESTFNLIGSIPVNDLGAQGYPASFRKIVRWGQNGLALSAFPSVFGTTGQIFIFQSPLVKDLSSSPADLSIALAAPAAITTGTPFQTVATLHNSGPNAASGATLALTLDPSLIINSITPSQGSCLAFACDLGALANGASATVTVTARATTPSTLGATASAASLSYDPNAANNHASASTAATGVLYSAVPVISTISPTSAQAGSASFLLTVTGSGFNSGSSIHVGVAAVPTNYVSATQLTATITSAQVATYGWDAISVTNPTPGGGVSPIVPLTVYTLVDIPANNIHVDPYTRLLYASITGTATTIVGNSVVTIDPANGTVGTPVLVGSEPTAMAETADGKYLYVSLSGANSLAQYDLLHQKLIQAVTLPPPPGGFVVSVPALNLDVMPGTDTTLALGLQGANGIFDINGSTGTYRPNLAGYNSYPAFADSTHLYTYDSHSSGAELYRYTVDASGATLLDDTTLDGIGGFSGAFKLANGLLYGAAGGIANPATTPPSQIATLPPVSLYANSSPGSPATSEPDPSLQKEFLMLQGGYTNGLVRYDLKTYQPEAFLNISLPPSTFGGNWTISRFSQDGLALLSHDYISPTPSVQLILLRGPFITPQELTSSSGATLTSSSSPTIAHGTGNIYLTLTGTNFLPGVAVTWNGAYRTTTVIDPGHVSIAVPASDLTNTGAAALVATNPGAPSSNQLLVTIN